MNPYTITTTTTESKPYYHGLRDQSREEDFDSRGRYVASVEGERRALSNQRSTPQLHGTWSQMEGERSWRH